MISKQGIWMTQLDVRLFNLTVRQRLPPPLGIFA